MKGAVETFTKYLVKEVGARGISANVVAPGLIQTEFTREAFENAQVIQFITSQTALSRTGVPEDIGGIVAFLCTEAARWQTAQRIDPRRGCFCEKLSVQNKGRLLLNAGHNWRTN